ncbi:MAG: GNAT family N-acetyltransferase [Sandaracinaceae bacterium]|nr:GNAT family N-acetyltransferase [Sandaracinaceae bacterium]
MPLLVRRASAGDLEAIRALLVELGYAALASEPRLGDVLDEVLADPMRAVWLAVDEDDVLGLATTTVCLQLRLAGRELTLEELVVRERARGRGVGRALVAHVKDEATRLGVVRVQLTTNTHRDVYLRRFYPKNGFVEASSAVMRWTP